jgi:uncharacterized protein (DUF486 family)
MALECVPKLVSIFHAWGVDYFEYLLGDPCYMGEEIFIMRRIGQRKFTPDVTQNVVRTQNKMHARFSM